jgi:hypothetical protein
MLMYWQDYQLIKEGRYVLPYDMATLQHRQFNPLYVLRKGAAFMREAVDTLRRRWAGGRCWCGCAAARHVKASGRLPTPSC